MRPNIEKSDTAVSVTQNAFDLSQNQFSGAAAESTKPSDLLSPDLMLHTALKVVKDLQSYERHRKSGVREGSIILQAAAILHCAPQFIEEICAIAEFDDGIYWEDLAAMRWENHYHPYTEALLQAGGEHRARHIAERFARTPSHWVQYFISATHFNLERGHLDAAGRSIDEALARLKVMHSQDETYSGDMAWNWLTVGLYELNRPTEIPGLTKPHSSANFTLARALGVYRKAGSYAAGAVLTHDRKLEEGHFYGFLRLIRAAHQRQDVEGVNLFLTSAQNLLNWDGASNHTFHQASRLARIAGETGNLSFAHALLEQAFNKLIKDNPKTRIQVELHFLANLAYDVMAPDIADQCLALLKERVTHDLDLRSLSQNFAHMGQAEAIIELQTHPILGKIQKKHEKLETEGTLLSSLGLAHLHTTRHSASTDGRYDRSTELAKSSKAFSQAIETWEEFLRSLRAEPHGPPSRPAAFHLANDIIKSLSRGAIAHKIDLKKIDENFWHL